MIEIKKHAFLTYTVMFVFLFILRCCLANNFEAGENFMSDVPGVTITTHENKSENLTICEQRQKKISHLSPVKGYIGAFIAIIMFGSNFVPVKKIKTGDGAFFQWIVCLGIWTSGVCIHIYNGHKRQFFPLEMIGGVLWGLGNICVVPIVKTIGLAMGLLIWGTLNLLTGWATGRFGMFGLICEQPVKHSALNYVGVMLAVISLVIFIFIKTENSALINTNRVERSEVIQDDGSEYESCTDDQTAYLLSTYTGNADSSWIDGFSTSKKRIIGILLSVVSGVLYGLCFVPVYIIQKNHADAPDDGLQYVFSQYSGTLLFSTVCFVIYSLYKRNNPDVFPKAVAPGFFSGVLWGIGQAGWFVANTYLSEAVSFPIVTTGPGIIASIWGVLIFKEITGWRNFLLLCVAICFAVSGATVTSFSK